MFCLPFNSFPQYTYICINERCAVSLIKSYLLKSLTHRVCLWTTLWNCLIQNRGRGSGVGGRGVGGGGNALPATFILRVLSAFFVLFKLVMAMQVCNQGQFSRIGKIVHLFSANYLSQSNIYTPCPAYKHQTCPNKLLETNALAYL